MIAPGRICFGRLLRTFFRLETALFFSVDKLPSVSPRLDISIGVCMGSLNEGGAISLVLVFSACLGVFAEEADTDDTNGCFNNRVTEYLAKGGILRASSCFK